MGVVLAKLSAVVLLPLVVDGAGEEETVSSEKGSEAEHDCHPLECGRTVGRGSVAAMMQTFSQVGQAGQIRPVLFAIKQSPLNDYSLWCQRTLTRLSRQKKPYRKVSVWSVVLELFRHSKGDSECVVGFIPEYIYTRIRGCEKGAGDNTLIYALYTYW